MFKIALLDISEADKNAWWLMSCNLNSITEQAGLRWGSFQQRWKKGWSTGALLQEGNGSNHSWQKDSGQVYRTCHDLYEKGF